MKKEFLPYLLPLISLIFAFILVGFNPNITGFAVKELGDKVSGNVIIFTDKETIIPSNSVVNVILDYQSKNMSIKEFIEKNGSWYELKTGNFPQGDYYGEGFSGNHEYSLSLEEFEFGITKNIETHKLIVRIFYNGLVISENELEVSK